MCVFSDVYMRKCVSMRAFRDTQHILIKMRSWGSALIRYSNYSNLIWCSRILRKAQRRQAYLVVFAVVVDEELLDHRLQLHDDLHVQQRTILFIECNQACKRTVYGFTVRYGSTVKSTVSANFGPYYGASTINVRSEIG